MTRSALKYILPGDTGFFVSLVHCYIPGIAQSLVREGFARMVVKQMVFAFLQPHLNSSPSSSLPPGPQSHSPLNLRCTSCSLWLEGTSSSNTQD